MKKHELEPKKRPKFDWRWLIPPLIVINQVVNLFSSLKDLLG